MEARVERATIRYPNAGLLGGCHVDECWVGVWAQSLVDVAGGSSPPHLHSLLG